jgi:hypothetical protein
MAEAYVIQPTLGEPNIKNKLMENVYGICIDMTNTDPTSAVTYTEDAVGMEPLANNSSTGVCSYGDWEDVITEVFGCAPCLYLSGARSKYLKPTNYAYDVDGNSVDITSGSAGDVMVEFSKCWYRWRVSGNYLYFEVTGKDMSGTSGWCCEAFKTSGGTVKDYMYYGAYEGYVLSNKLRSLSGKTPTVSTTIGNFRTYATAMGSNYQQEEIAKRMYIIGLLFLVTKSRDGQATCGNGWVGQSAAATTGTQNTAGLFFGSSSKTTVVKVFGIENFWGSLWKWCDGFVSAGSTSMYYKSYGPYNDTGSGYTTATGIYNGSGYPKTMTVLGNGIIAATAGGGSTTTCFPDSWYLNTSSGCVCYVGGYWNYDLGAGPLSCRVNCSASYADSGIGARLSAC